MNGLGTDLPSIARVAPGVGVEIIVRGRRGNAGVTSAGATLDRGASSVASGRRRER